MEREKIMVAMSGGVDSALAAYLLCRDGADCAGVTMRLGVDNERDARDARAVAEKVGIPHTVVQMQAIFRRTVMEPFAAAYEAGLTPNPCYLCNREIKFGALLESARQMGYPLLATGHYARVEKSGERFLLRKGADPEKDQSYFLAGLSQAQLACVRFPLGNLRKSEVKALAATLGLVSEQRRESQDVCFVPDGKYAEVIERMTGKTYPAGDFVTPDGKVLGRHRGLIRYTVGQRKGLGLSLPAPLYVCEKRVRDNCVALSDNASLFSATVHVGQMNWIAFDQPAEPFRAYARIRYRQKEQPATVFPMEAGQARIVFDTPQRAVTPGQAAVLYDGDTVIGGGIIQG